VSKTDPQVSLTDTPTVTPTSDSGSELVRLEMLLTGAAGMLAGRAAIAWESITARYIEEISLKEKNWRVSVTVNIDEQQIVTGSAGFGSKRFLQGDTNIKSLIIKFDANVDFISVPRRVSAEDLIGESFNSVSEREIYRDKLLAADPVFTSLTAVQVRVEGAVPIEEPLGLGSQATSSPGNKSMVGEMVGIVISVLLLVAFVALFIVRRQRHYSKDHYGGTDPTNVSMPHDPNIAVVTVAALPEDKLIKNGHVEEIHVSDIEDDAVSAMTSLPGLNGRGGAVEDRTVSVNLDYDLFVEQLKQQKTDSKDNESEASYDASRSRTTEAGTSLSPTLLGLDYLEEVTNEDDDDAFPSAAMKWPSDNESKGASYDAPRGKTTVAGTSLYSPTLLGFDYLEYLGEVRNEDDNGDDYAALFPSDAMRWPSQYLPPNKLEFKEEEVTNENDDDDDLSALFPSDAMKWASH
jgi:hypothetical protein